ncbi:MAG: hypothetical protein ETSY2_24045 [Candidatus Entotheonella gemina]|uniref:Uncharacterized protein n=1 Tax=Candidatus Entotheonella gemina TaxID=1429439 RepID=W4M5P3_9BACT|nr:MAG: hypothetical protein ETSY2_24045 [Candidatus Entotheonella gemina]
MDDEITIPQKLNNLITCLCCSQEFFYLEMYFDYDSIFGTHRYDIFFGCNFVRSMTWGNFA